MANFLQQTLFSKRSCLAKKRIPLHTNIFMQGRLLSSGGAKKIYAVYEIEKSSLIYVCKKCCKYSVKFNPFIFGKGRIAESWYWYNHRI